MAERLQGDAASGDAAGDNAADAGLDAASAACDRSGPRLRVGDNSPAGTVCPQGTPARAFLHAVCVCEDYAAGNTLLTDAVDSSSADFPAASAGGAVGVNGRLGNSGFYMQIGGSLLVAGPLGVTIAPSPSPSEDLRVLEDLELGGSLQGAGCGVAVGRDARVAGRVVLQDLAVGGRLSVPGEFEISVSGSERIGSLVREPVQVRSPCGCEERDMADIAAAVNERETANENALLDFDIDELQSYRGPVTRELPCGRFYLRRLSGQGSLDLVVSGRAALYVPEPANLDGPFSVQLRPGAELDLFFAATLTAGDGLQLGSPNEPERVRIYVGGDGTVDLAGQSLLAGHLYAPRAELVSRGRLEVFGSVFVRRLSDSGGLVVHQDENPLEAGEPCP